MNPQEERANRNYEAAYGSQLREQRSSFLIVDADGSVQAWTDDAEKAKAFLRLYPGGKIVQRNK